MICVDSSALLAIVLREPERERCREALSSDPKMIISAATVAEALIVATGRGVREPLEGLLDLPGLQVVDVTKADAVRAADAYRRWGKGFDKARLNYGDCFAYALAADRGCALLYVGQDFSLTDIESVL